MIIRKYILFIALVTHTVDGQGQASVNTAGGDALGVTGSYSVTYGQTQFLSIEALSGEMMCQGVQIPYEFFDTFCPEDINQDGIIGIGDFIQFNSAFGDFCASCPEDTNRDGQVGIDDFIQLNSAYGNSCDTGN
jgi:hypothetical protein